MTSAHVSEHRIHGSGRGADARVLVVADPALAAKLRASTGGVMGRAVDDNLQVVEVDGFLAALGEVAHRPADTVIGPMAAMSGMLPSMGQALRRLVPRARLIVTVANDHNTDGLAALEAGFDAVLCSPVEIETVIEELGGAIMEKTQNSRALQADTAPYQTGPLKNSGGHAGIPPATAKNPGWKPAPQVFQTPQAKNGHDATPTRFEPQEDIAALGDVDLVEALLHDRQAFKEMALRIIAARSGLGKVGWAADRSGTPHGHTCSEVRVGSKVYGLLHGAGAKADVQLGGWAAWLSRWFSLADRMGELEHQAMHDALTGVWNRRYFNQFLARILTRAQEDRSQVTLLLFDIDNFKSYNDNYGHPAGDEILEGIGGLMRSVVREHDVVARIGGDEFAVIFWDVDAPRRANSKHPQDVIKTAKRFQKAVCSHRFPKLLNEQTGILTISGGMATFPWDGKTPAELLDAADRMALKSKRQGKNVITFGSGAREYCCGNDENDE